MFGKRLFTLGCSYTNYWYPTWADWLGSEFNYYENLGISGLGNRGIFNRLSELIYKRKVNENDHVVVEWSTPTREDRYFSGKGWLPKGSVYNQSFYSKDFIKKYYDPFMGLMETINYIHAAKLMLNAVNCNFAMTFMIKLNGIMMKPDDDSKSYTELCDPENKLKDYLEYVLSDEHVIDIDMDRFCKECAVKYEIPNPARNLFHSDELHPNPLSHYFYTKEIISKHLGFDNFDESGAMLDLANKWCTYATSYPRNTLQPRWPKNNNSTFTQLHFL